MKEKETLWEKMFKKTPKEEEIQSRIDAELERFDNSPEHLAHKERLKVLFAEMRQAQAERKEEGKRYRREKFPRKSISISEEDIEKRRAESNKRYEETIEALSEPLKTSVKIYNSLSDSEKDVFDRTTFRCFRNELAPMKKTQITHEQTRQLHDILVQTCIDFINENNLKDVDVVAFSADSLQESSRWNEWTPATDSFLTLEGDEYDDECKCYVRKFIDRSF